MRTQVCFNEYLSISMPFCSGWVKPVFVHIWQNAEQRNLMVIMLYMFAIYALFVARCMHVTEALCVHKLYMTSSRMFVVSMWHVCFFPLRYISGSLLTAVNCSILLHNIADECVSCIPDYKKSYLPLSCRFTRAQFDIHPSAYSACLLLLFRVFLC